MARIGIAQLDITERVRDKIWDHRIVPDQLYAVLDRFWRPIRNRKGRAVRLARYGRSGALSRHSDRPNR